MTSVQLADQSTSWGQLRDEAARLAPRVAGARAIAVVAEPTAHTIASILAALDAAVPVIPLSADTGATDRAHVLADSGAELMVDGGQITELPGTRSPDPLPRDTALILYTSGTTGAPKGVPVSASAITACIAGLADAWEWNADDLLVHGLPLHHVHGLVLGVLGPLQVGCRLHHTGRPTPASYAAARGTLYFGVPTVWSRIAADPAAAQSLASARLLVSGSAAMNRTTFDELARLVGRPPIERYGMTETLITVSARADAPTVQGAVGVALPGIQTRLVDDAGNQSPRDGETIGGLQVSGPTVFEGYLNRPDATAAAFTDDGWFETGDVATIDAAGVHRIVGRASIDLIKSGGYRIGAGEVEDALLAHPAVTEAAVVGEPDDDLGQRIVAYVVASDASEADLVAHVATQLSWHKRPRRVVFVDVLPRNAMGKVEKARLAADLTP